MRAIPRLDVLGVLGQVFLESLMGLERSLQDYANGEPVTPVHATFPLRVLNALLHGMAVRKLEPHIRELFLANNFYYVTKMVREHETMREARPNTKPRLDLCAYAHSSRPVGQRKITRLRL